MKNIGHYACSQAQDHRTSLPGPCIKKQTVFSECERTYLSDYVIFMYTGAILRNHLNNITFFFVKC